MSYLACMLVIVAFTAVFLLAVRSLERGTWPSDRAASLGDLVRELFLRA